MRLINLLLYYWEMNWSLYFMYFNVPLVMFGDFFFYFQLDMFYYQNFLVDMKQKKKKGWKFRTLCDKVLNVLMGLWYATKAFTLFLFPFSIFSIFLWICKFFLWIARHGKQKKKKVYRCTLVYGASKGTLRQTYKKSPPFNPFLCFRVIHQFFGEMFFRFVDTEMLINYHHLVCY